MDDGRRHLSTCSILDFDPPSLPARLRRSVGTPVFHSVHGMEAGCTDAFRLTDDGLLSLFLLVLQGHLWHFPLLPGGNAGWKAEGDAEASPTRSRQAGPRGRAGLAEEGPMPDGDHGCARAAAASPRRRRRPCPLRRGPPGSERDATSDRAGVTVSPPRRRGHRGSHEQKRQQRAGYPR